MLGFYTDFADFFQINLRLILVSGKTKEFLFSPNDSAADITDTVYSNWPSGTENQKLQFSAFNTSLLVFKIFFSFKY